MRKTLVTIAGASLLAIAPAATAQDSVNPQIDYDGFVELTITLQETRQAHLIDLATFQAKAQEADAIILDTRSAEAFRLGHLEGAINLPFSDFTADKLRTVLGADTGRPVLIYCNNNFSDNQEPVFLKVAPLALNIPTFINLHGYGYNNVWELADIVSTEDVDWVAQPLFPQQATEITKPEPRSS